MATDRDTPARSRHRHSEALEAYRAAVRARPGYAAAWGNLGMTAYLLGRFEESEDAFETARTFVPDYFYTRPIQRQAWEASRLRRPPLPTIPSSLRERPTRGPVPLPPARVAVA